MPVGFLIDENIEDEVVHRLEKRGYTVEYVKQHPELGKGTEDTTIAEFSSQNGLVILTHDPDFLLEHDESEFFGAVFFKDDDLSAKQVSDIVHKMATHYPKSAFRGIEYGSSNWL